MSPTQTVDAISRGESNCPRTVAVEADELDGRFVLIATGAVPMRLGIAGEEHLATSTDFLEFDELPKRIALLGGGFISAEFAHIASRAGTQVTILEQMDRMLTQFDPDLVGWLMEKTRQVGIDIQLGVRVIRGDKINNYFSIGEAYFMGLLARKICSPRPAR